MAEKALALLDYFISDPCNFVILKAEFMHISGPMYFPIHKYQAHTTNIKPKPIKPLTQAHSHYPKPTVKKIITINKKTYPVFPFPKLDPVIFFPKSPKNPKFTKSPITLLPIKLLQSTNN